jgi:hypothetical protein
VDEKSRAPLFTSHGGVAPPVDGATVTVDNPLGLRLTNLDILTLNATLFCTRSAVKEAIRLAQAIHQLIDTERILDLDRALDLA